MVRWTHHMRCGDFEAAWRVSDAILHSTASTANASLPRHLRSVWRGAPLTGQRVLIRCHHGLGDTLQFIRYAARVRAVAREVIVAAQPRLIPVVHRVDGIDRVIPLDDPDAETAFDVDCEVTELPHVFRTTLADIPADVPYIAVDPAPRADDGPLAVGLVWRAGDWAPHRSVPVALLEPLARVPGVALHILQRGPGLLDRPEGFGIVCGSDDVLADARLIRSLDLVISVDTMVAHLAGALAVPTWLMLPAHADWRWLERRDDSPWYPTMRLFRQEVDGDWNAVVARIDQELRRAAAGGPAARKRLPKS